MVCDTQPASEDHNTLTLTHLGSDPQKQLKLVVLPTIQESFNADAIKAALPEYTNEYGTLTLSVSPSVAGNKWVSTIIGFSKAGTKSWPKVIKATFQLDLSCTDVCYMSPKQQQRRTDRPHPTVPAQTRTVISAVTLGPYPSTLYDAREGALVMCSFAAPLPGADIIDRKVSIKQLVVTLDPIFERLPISSIVPLSLAPTLNHAVCTSAARAPPGPVLIDTINDSALCDCTFTLKGDVQLAASKLILACASPFFATMFKEPQWAGNAAEPHKFDSWSVKAFVPCLLHVYVWWVPQDGELPKAANLNDVIDKHEVVPGKYSLHEWFEVLDLAQMLELPALVTGVKKVMVGLLEE